MSGSVPDRSAPDDAAALSAWLEGLRQKRGYLLPHHGLLAITDPALLERYDALYSGITLDGRLLSAHDREFVWLAILIATRERIATHHVARFLEAGGTDAEMQRVIGIAAFCLGFPAYAFVGEHWVPHAPELAPRAAYLAALDHIGGGQTDRLGHLAAAVVHSCAGHHEALAWQIEAAYAASVPEAELAEALSLAMLPGSVPNFVHASRIWRDLIRDGRVAASPAFRAWAEMEGQDGHRARPPFIGSE
jgi:alkylhydroperoxidase/carboxymuconolactone decarboxylase family protein YurZ